jgi:hypothetical protein
MGAEGMQSTVATEAVEPMEDAEEEKALPPEQTADSVDGENDGAGGKN